GLPGPRPPAPPTGAHRVERVPTAEAALLVAVDGRNRHWHPVRVTYSIATAASRRSEPRCGPRLPGLRSSGRHHVLPPWAPNGTHPARRRRSSLRRHRLVAHNGGPSTVVPQRTPLGGAGRKDHR